MIEPSLKLPPQERTSTYLYFSSLYFVTVGVLYLWGYWSTFNVNILEYLSLADIIKSTAYPIASAFVFMVLGAAIGEVLADDSSLAPGAGRNTPTGKFLLRFYPWLVVIYAIVTIALLVLGPVDKWLALPVLFAMPAYLYFRRLGLFNNVLRHDSARSLAIFLMATLPTFGYGHGRIRAQEIVDGVKFEYAISPIENVSVVNDASPGQRPRFLGHAGDFIFFLEPMQGTLVISKFEGTKSLVLKHFDRPSALPMSSTNSSNTGPLKKTLP